MNEGVRDPTRAVLPPYESVADIGQILRALPHRYPMLMIDRVVEMQLGLSAVGIKNVSVDEAFFQGHFPAHPVMPGVLVIESMAQTAAALVIETLGLAGVNPLVYFMSIGKAKFRKPVVPGDQLRIHVAKNRERGNVLRFSGMATVEGLPVAEAVLTAMIMNAPVLEQGPI